MMMSLICVQPGLSAVKGVQLLSFRPFLRYFLSESITKIKFFVKWKINLNIHHLKILIENESMVHFNCLESGATKKMGIKKLPNVENLIKTAILRLDKHANLACYWTRISVFLRNKG